MFTDWRLLDAQEFVTLQICFAVHTQGSIPPPRFVPTFSFWYRCNRCNILKFVVNSNLNSLMMSVTPAFDDVRFLFRNVGGILSRNYPILIVWPDLHWAIADWHSISSTLNGITYCEWIAVLSQECGKYQHSNLLAYTACRVIGGRVGSEKVRRCTHA